MRYGQDQRHSEASNNTADPLDQGTGCRRNVFGRFDEPAENVARIDKHREDRCEVDSRLGNESIAEHSYAVDSHDCFVVAVVSV